MPGGIKKAYKAKYPGEGSSSEYKETMGKLKKYWPQSTIDLYMSKAISLHDLDSFITDEKSLADINQVVLNIDEWYKKNPEYSFMKAAKLLKEKANIPTPENISSYESEGSLSRVFGGSYRTRTRYERAQEEDQYSRRSPEFEEDMSDGEFLGTIGIDIAQESPVRPQRAQTEPSDRAETTARWDHMFGSTTAYASSSASLNENVMPTIQEPSGFEVLGGTTPEGNVIRLARNSDGTMTGVDESGAMWTHNPETGIWNRH